MALTLTTGKTFANGEKVTPAKLNQAVNEATYTGELEVAKGGTGSATAAGARSNLGLGSAAVEDTSAFDAAGAADAAIASSAQRASNLSDLASAATARGNLGLFGSSLEHATSGGIQAGSAGTDLIYTGGPSINLTVGTWLVWGSAGMRTNDAIGEFYLGFRNTTDGSDFGKGATTKNDSLAVIYEKTCFALVTVADTKTIRLKGFIAGAQTLEMGSTNGFSGVIRALRLTT